MTPFTKKEQWFCFGEKILGWRKDVHFLLNCNNSGKKMSKKEKQVRMEKNEMWIDIQNSEIVYEQMEQRRKKILKNKVGKKPEIE